jgi:hypothetical protein
LGDDTTLAQAPTPTSSTLSKGSEVTLIWLVDVTPRGRRVYQRRAELIRDGNIILFPTPVSLLTEFAKGTSATPLTTLTLTQAPRFYLGVKEERRGTWIDEAKMGSFNLIILLSKITNSLLW